MQAALTIANDFKPTEANIDAVLKASISQHGYWLVNHKGIIREHIAASIDIHGTRDTVALLDNLNTHLVDNIYSDIRKARRQEARG